MMPQLLKEQNITNSILYYFEHHRIQSLTKLLNLQMKIHDLKNKTSQIQYCITLNIIAFNL